MSDHQNVIDNIDYVLADIKKLKGFVSVIQTFLSTPRTKKEIRDFSESYLLDTVFSVAELNPLYTRLTLAATDINIDLVQNTIRQVKNPLVEQLKSAIKKKMVITYDSVLCAVQNEYAITPKDTDEGKIRCIDLYYSLEKIHAIFATARQFPVDSGQFVSLAVNEDKCVDLSRSINETAKTMLEDTSRHLDKVFTGHFLDFINEDIGQLDPFFCQNNYLSLRNFIVYIKSL